MTATARLGQKHIACNVSHNTLVISRITSHVKHKNLRCFHLTILLLLTIVLTTITACGGSANIEPAPPGIHYGEDICEFCGMIISEERYAAGYITDSGEEFIFDDIGDLVKAYMQDQGDIKATFVHDYDNHTWIRGENAYYVLSPNLPTPMLSGLAAFPSIEMAEEFSAEMDGQVLTFDELLTYYRENSPEPAFSSLTGN